MSALAKSFGVRIESRNDFGVGLRIGELYYTMDASIKFSAENVNSFIADAFAGKIQGKLVVRIIVIFHSERV